MGTCNLTTRGKSGFIRLTSQNEDTVQFILDKYQDFINIISQYPESTITLLEVSVYSITKYNKKIEAKIRARKERHNHQSNFDTDTKIEQFEEQNKQLELQISKINESIRYLNETLNRGSPNFSISLQSRRQRSRSKNKPTEKYFNYNLYSDGIHLQHLLAKTWLRELVEQIQKDCWW